MKKYKLCLLLAVLTAALMLLLAGCGETAANLEEYVGVKFSGMDGEGKAAVELDKDALYAVLGGKDYTDGNADKKQKALDRAETAMDSVAFKLDQSEGLSNGDKVTVTISYNNELAKASKVQFSGKTKTFTVSGLKEYETLDAFDASVFNVEQNGIVLKFSGFAPNASLEIKNQLPASDPRSQLSYRADKSYGLSNGDIITVTAAMPSDYASQGFRLKETSLTFAVNGAAEPTVLDAFDPAYFWIPQGEGLTVSFNGYAPNGQLILQNSFPSDNPLSKANYSADRYASLKNGDTVTVTVSLKLDGYRLKEEKKEVVISGISEPTVLDAFDPAWFGISEGEGLIVEYAGISPELTVQLRNTFAADNPLSRISYQQAEYGRVAKGETVKIKASLPYDMQEAYVLKETEGSVVVDNVAFYITSMNEIDEATLAKIRQQCDDMLASYAAKPSPYYAVVDGHPLSGANTLANFAYDDFFFLTLKEGLTPGYGEEHNAFYVGYRVDAASKGGITYKAYDLKGLYSVLYVKDLVMDRDGKLLFDVSMVTVPTGTHAVGANKDDFINTIVFPKKDKYEVTSQPSGWED